MCAFTYTMKSGAQWRNYPCYASQKVSSMKELSVLCQSESFIKILSKMQWIMKLKEILRHLSLTSNNNKGILLFFYSSHSAKEILIMWRCRTFWSIILQKLTSINIWLPQFMIHYEHIRVIVNNDCANSLRSILTIAESTKI